MPQAVLNTEKNININHLERFSMDFVNEYASEGDIEKFDLYGIFDKYKPFHKYKKAKLPISWTINSERDVFLLLIREGREELCNRVHFLLWYQGEHVLFDVDTVGNLNPDGIKSDPFKIRWEMVATHFQNDSKLSKEEVTYALRSALEIYGYMGAYKQLPNTIVECDF